ncbi:MAG TPA: PilZ domain-containing protein [Firmicutes bacterium]|nr:PilZ domain-containing protein [Bacillota bacterium]
MVEKRRFTRVPFRIATEITAGELAFQGEVKDLSLKGMFIFTEHLLEIGTPLDIKINLTGKQSNLQIALQGKVLRKTPDGIVVVFDTVELDSFIHLKNIVAYNSADPEKIMTEYIRGQAGTS